MNVKNVIYIAYFMKVWDVFISEGSFIRKNTVYVIAKTWVLDRRFCT